jgi:GWxTD domain-containing protein
MDNNQRAILAVLTLAVGVALPAAFAQKMNKIDRDWLEQEVGALILKEERQVFESLGSDEERAVFKQIFWARRDPSPATPVNEFKDGYEQRLTVANREFKAPTQVGAATDMGKIFLLLGAPNQSGSGRTTDVDLAPDDMTNAEGSTTERILSGTGGTSPTSGARGAEETSGADPFGQTESQTLTQTWSYPPNEGLGIPDGLSLKFRAQQGFGYRLMSGGDLSETLERVKSQYVVNPTIEYLKDDQGRLLIPALGGAMRPVHPVLQELRDNRSVLSDVSFKVKVSFFRYETDLIFIPAVFDIDGANLDWMEDQVPVSVLGLVENSEGKPVTQFVQSTLLTKSPSGRSTFEIPLELQPGRYLLYLAVRDEASGSLGTQIQSLEVPPVIGETLSISSVVLFTEGQKLEEPIARAGQAFVIGGYHFVPKLDAVYQKTDQLSGVFQAYGYGIGEEGANLTARYLFYRDGEPAGKTQDEPFISAGEKFAITVFDIPLEGFEPGKYLLKIQVSDHVNGKMLTKELQFELK